MHSTLIVHLSCFFPNFIIKSFTILTMKKENHIALHSTSFIHEIKQIVTEARQKAYTAINSAMVEAYWLMGKRIVEEEQQGKERADYGTQLLKELSTELTQEFGKGFSVPSLYNYRLFYQTFPEIFSTPWRILSWSHYKRLLTVPNPEARAWYLKEAQEQMWSYRTLNRNIGSQYYERLLLSHDKEKSGNGNEVAHASVSAGQIGVYQESYGSGVYRIVSKYRLYRIQTKIGYHQQLTTFLA
jgi:hypothetical protein